VITALLVALAVPIDSDFAGKQISTVMFPLPMDFINTPAQADAQVRVKRTVTERSRVGMDLNHSYVVPGVRSIEGLAAAPKTGTVSKPP
jgi:hypothetical protein